MKMKKALQKLRNEVEEQTRILRGLDMRLTVVLETVRNIEDELERRDATDSAANVQPEE
jgi:hypothetical protein